MARIRSIKPEFFTSESNAALPLSARLTFIGLWTHCDDNGVCIDSLPVIVGAVWPVEAQDDPRGVSGRTREDLARLAGDGKITRYACGGKKYIFVTEWDQHQRVSHPGKQRYPRPDSRAVTPVTSPPATLPPPSRDSPATLPRLSRDSPATRAPDLGAGSREQGDTRVDVVTTSAGSRRRTGQVIHSPIQHDPDPAEETERHRQLTALEILMEQSPHTNPNGQATPAAT